MRSGLKVIVFLALFTSAAATSFGFEPKFYDGVENPDKLHELFSIENSADRKLFCDSLDRISLGINDKDGNEEYFTLRQLENFLQSEKHKDFIFVQLHTLYRKTWADQIESFLLRAGYKRILIVGGSASGAIVLKDTSSGAPVGKPLPSPSRYSHY